MPPKLDASLPTAKSPCVTRTLCSVKEPISSPWTSCRTRLCRRIFPPRKTQPHLKWKNKGPQPTSHQTVNGRMEFSRTVYWNEQAGTVVPLDELLGITANFY